MMKQCQYGILSASVRGVCELHWILLEAGSCEKYTQNQSLHTLERDGSEGDRAEVILYFWGRFLWYRDDGSCLPKKRDVASVQGLLTESLVKTGESVHCLRIAPVTWSGPLALCWLVLLKHL